MESDKIYTIREVSKMFDLPVSTLRYYEDEGILTNVGRSASNQRIYYEAHINRLRSICCFKRTGMSIAKLKDFFSLEKDEENSIDDMIELLELQEKSVEDKLKELHADYDHVQKKIRFYKDIKKAMENGQSKPDWECHASNYSSHLLQLYRRLNPASPSYHLS